MIKRNPLVKTKSQTIRKKEVKELLSDVGINFFDNKEWEQFEVWPKGDKRGEDSTYFTIKRSSEDLEDALQTGLDMAKRLGKGKPKFLVQNPRLSKCRTFQTKRKVGKRVIKVTRKICRNPINYSVTNDDLLKLVGNKVNLYLTDGKNNHELLIKGILEKLPNIKISYIKNMNKWKVSNKNNSINFISFDLDGIDENNIYTMGTIE